MNAYEKIKHYLQRGKTIPIDHETLCLFVDCVNEQADRIAELEKQSEPVAWMDKRTNKCVVFINTPPSDDWIPLYTTPQTKQSEWGDSVVSKKKYQQAQLEARSYLLGYLDGKEGVEAKVRGEK
jgi:hypothetical protein